MHHVGCDEMSAAHLLMRIIPLCLLDPSAWPVPPSSYISLSLSHVFWGLLNDSCQSNTRVNDSRHSHRLVCRTRCSKISHRCSVGLRFVDHGVHSFWLMSFSKSVNLSLTPLCPLRKVWLLVFCFFFLTFLLFLLHLPHDKLLLFPSVFLILDLTTEPAHCEPWFVFSHKRQMSDHD